MPGLKKTIFFSAAIGFFGLLAAVVPWIGALEEGIGLHMLFQMRGVRSAPEDVVVIALDRQSTKELNLPMQPRKWPRTVHARLIDRLSKAGAAVIVFDMIFNEVQSSETDLALAEAIQRAGNVILTQSIIDETISVTDEKGVITANVNIEKIVPPIDIIGKAALAQAPFPVPRIPVKLSRFWTFKPGSGDAPAMPVVAFNVFAKEAFCQLKTHLAQGSTGRVETDAGPLPPCNEKFGWYNTIQAMHADFQRSHSFDRSLNTLPDRYTEPTATHMRSLIRLYSSDTSRHIDFYGPAKTMHTIAYHRILNEPDDVIEQFGLKGKAVFVGQTESYWPKAKDGFYTVYANETSVDISGVEIAATAFANLLENRDIMPLAMPIHIGLLVLWGISMAVVSLRFSAGTSAAVLVGAAVGYLWLAHTQFGISGTWYPIVVPIFLMTPLCYFCALFWKLHIINRERRTIREAFGYYLPNHVVDQLSRNLGTIASARQEVYSICLFTDAGNYTRLSETMDPDSLTSLMNQYYEVIFKPVRDNGGVVLQVVGDSVLSMWTAPAPDPALEAKACRAALEIAGAVAQFNRQPGEQALPTRIGMHAGYVVLGNIGAVDHFEYRPVGDIVNTASRLEGLNKYLQTRILASGATIGQVRHLTTRYLGKFVFVGKSVPVDTFEIMEHEENHDATRKQMIEQFEKALRLFTQQLWPEACDAFNRILAIQPEDGPSLFYAQQCRDYQACPPGPGWNGAIHLKQK